MISKLKERHLAFGSRLTDVANRSGLSISRIWNLENNVVYRVEEDTRRKLAKCLKNQEKDLFKDN